MVKVIGFNSAVWPGVIAFHVYVHIITKENLYKNMYSIIKTKHFTKIDVLLTDYYKVIPLYLCRFEYIVSILDVSLQ